MKIAPFKGAPLNLLYNSSSREPVSPNSGEAAGTVAFLGFLP